MSAACFLALFVAAFFGASLYRWIRDEPLDGFDVNKANQLKLIAQQSLVNFDARRRNPSVMAAGLAVKYTTLELIILRLNHLRTNVVPTLRRELQRENDTDNTKGFRRISESINTSCGDIDQMREDLGKWIELIDPIVSTSLRDHLIEFATFMRQTEQTLGDWGKLEAEAFSHQRQTILNTLKDIVTDTTQFEKDIKSVSDDLKTDLDQCRSLVTVL